VLGLPLVARGIVASSAAVEVREGDASVGRAFRKLRVAAVQMPSANGQIAANLQRASQGVEEAVAAGAELVLLPEFLATGYMYSRQIWDAAEPRDGPTAQWLAHESKRHRVYLGASFLEADGADFFNTFVLTTPSGQEAGRVRKQTPASYEAFFTRGDAGSHVIDTELGRIGVGVCYENHLAFSRELFYRSAVDLVLMPHSAPSIERRGARSAKFLDVYHAALRNVSVECALALGVPVVMVNKCGPWISPIPGTRRGMNSTFPGLSAIVDSDGSVKARLAAEAGVLIEDVCLDPSRKARIAPMKYGRWVWPLSIATRLMAYVTQYPELIGPLVYRLSRERAARALAVSRAAR
jgi:N-carbamoylputrescine amidase